jgi:hypothetical protein
MQAHSIFAPVRGWVLLIDGHVSRQDAQVLLNGKVLSKGRGKGRRQASLKITPVLLKGLETVVQKQHEATLSRDGDGKCE